MWKKLKNKFSSNNTIFTENFFKNLRGLNSQLTVDELKNIERDLIKSETPVFVRRTRKTLLVTRPRIVLPQVPSKLT